MRNQGRTRVEIIAEIAQGYEGDPTIARLLAKGAVRAEADAVKFQLVYADELATPDYPHYDLFRSLEMPHDSWQQVKKIISEGGKKLYFDVFGEMSLREAIALEADGVKIHTTDFFNTPLIRRALEKMPRLFISFGGISVAELEEFIRAHQLSPSTKVCFMYGFQAEPTPIGSNNLSRISSLKKKFPEYSFGYMDHADGGSEDANILALMALPFGIDCIEKHISLDRLLEIEDYLSALPPDSFRDFVKRVRHLEEALGSESLDPSAPELAYRNKVLKVVVANRPLSKGETLRAECLTLKRVGMSAPSGFYRLEQVEGRVLKSDVQLHQQITKDVLS